MLLLNEIKIRRASGLSDVSLDFIAVCEKLEFM